MEVDRTLLEHNLFYLPRFLLIPCSRSPTRTDGYQIGLDVILVGIQCIRVGIRSQLVDRVAESSQKVQLTQ